MKMNLYVINLEHFSGDDSKKGIITYLFAESNEAVYEWLKTNPRLKDNTLINSHYDRNSYKVFDLYDDKYKVIGVETHMERMIRLGGEMNDPDAEVEDRYYGVTLYGWSLVKETLNQAEIDILTSVGILVEFADEEDKS
jgi:hypothetical protein